MRYAKLISAMSMLAIPVTASAEDCRPVFLNGDRSLVVDGVEIEPTGRAVQDFLVGIRNSAGVPGGSFQTSGNAPGESQSRPCVATIRVARLGAIPDPEFPPYLLRGPGNQRLEILLDPASGGTQESDLNIANVPPGPQGRTVPFQIAVPTEWGLRSGTYLEQLELLLIDQDGEIVDRTALTLTIIIPTAVTVRLVGAVTGGAGDGPAQVDLGNLSNSRETYSQPFAARIFSSAPYSVTLSSANQGNLLHEQGRERVSYRLYFDGTLVDLAGASEFHYLDHTPKRGDQRAMRIVVPPVVALAGRYSDRITITATAI